MKRADIQWYKFKNPDKKRPVLILLPLFADPFLRNRKNGIVRNSKHHRNNCSDRYQQHKHLDAVILN